MKYGWYKRQIGTFKSATIEYDAFGILGINSAALVLSQVQIKQMNNPKAFEGCHICGSYPERHAQREPDVLSC